MLNRRTAIKILLGVLIVALSLVALYSGFKIITSFVVPHTDVADEDASKTVVKDGVEYFPRQDITTFMLMGIDRSGKVEASGTYNNEGAADMIAVAVFDHKQKAYNLLMLNRDTITDIPVLGVTGTSAGEIKAQLALAHTYGTGLEDSCENTKNAVSKLLGGVDIDYYMSMNMDAASIVTDKIGGVTVNVTEDMSAIDPSIPMGETKLNGAQAFNFVRGRQGVGDQLNLSRMNRQKQFMEGFIDSVKSAPDNENLAATVYNSIADYIVSNCPVTTFSSLLEDCSDYTLEGVITPEGENVKGDEYMEFHIDDSALEDLVIDVFYNEKPEY